MICLWDIIAKGGHPNECVELIKENCDVVLMGNCDKYFTSDCPLDDKSSIEVMRLKWNRKLLNEDSKKYLLTLGFSYEFYLSGRLVRLFHASPDSINRYVGIVDSYDKKYSLFLPSENTLSNNYADIVLYGHIHAQYMQKIYNRTIINCGSVGNSYDIIRNDLKDGNNMNTTVCNYIILSGILDSKSYNDTISYELVSLPYNIDKELEDVSNNCEIDSYINELRNGKYRQSERKLQKMGIRSSDL